MTSEFVVLVAGLAVGAGAAVAIRYAFERFARRGIRPSDPPAGAALPAPVSAPNPAGEPKVDHPVSRSAPATGRREEFGATVRRSERVILHIYAQGRWGPGETVPPAITQAGIGSAVGSTQSALAKTLSRLRAGGVVEVELRHVRGGARRFKVYRLTPLGESLARNLREVELRRRTPASDQTTSAPPP
jgi:DNA-binding PadR family transcriptional regulator